MADIDEKTPLNVPGKFYVDSSCIDCDLCRETAPENFGRDDDEGVSYVKKQPDNDEELSACEEALEGCPVEAIGDDGEYYFNRPGLLVFNAPGFYFPPMSSPWFPYTPDRDRPDPHASPVRYDYLSRDEQEVRQALADWFQISPATSETRNLHTAESLLGDILSKLPLDGDGMDPELLRAGWLKAAGPFLGQQSNLLSIVKGVATIQVLQPAMRYHLQQWQGALLGKLKDQFGKDAVHSIRIRIG